MKPIIIEGLTTIFKFVFVGILFILIKRFKPHLSEMKVLIISAVIGFILFMIIGVLLRGGVEIG